MDRRLVRISKKISLALRHRPEDFGLELDEHASVPLDALLGALNERFRHSEAVTGGKPITHADVERIIEESDKQRFAIEGDRIRALYGHSVAQRVSVEAAIPPAVLYHGTTRAAIVSIRQEGLLPMGRQYVHLSADRRTAYAVGKRRDSDPVLLEVDASAAHEAGIAFYIGNDKVWLADRIPPAFLTES
ncbi:MAG: RNA 2'-phosphotransferase [Atopobiaceae bacterium]|nr:RNA 2'-phosphotransferase [Atopobiaceae bacterium]